MPSPTRTRICWARLSGRSRLATVISSSLPGLHPCDAAGLHAQHAARLMHDDLHGAPDVETGRHRPAGLQERPRLAGPPFALLEELGVVDGDARLLAERLQQVLVVGGEDAGVRGKGRDDPDRLARVLEGHAEHGANPLLLVDIPAGRAWIGPDVADPDGHAARRAAPADAFPHRHGERPPGIRLEAVRGGVHEILAPLVHEPDPASRAADEGGDGVADLVEHRGQL